MYVWLFTGLSLVIALGKTLVILRALVRDVNLANDGVLNMDKMDVLNLTLKVFSCFFNFHLLFHYFLG